MDTNITSDKKILILIVAYNAEKTISSVLNRIPVEMLPGRTEVLVIDDSSSDATFSRAQANISDCPVSKITVLRNPVNQGYGGNQKIGYQYAIEKGFDIVALLHGDGQYAPEKLPELIRPVLDGEADACFGSRMMEKGAALRCGMPLYKYIGNKILTGFQNAMLDSKLTEFHSGYRVYAVNALRNVPFKYNTNDFHFDTEIIIQFLMAGLRIKEIPIPTYYGDEICYVNGLAYAWNVFKSTMASRIHRMGLLFQRKYDVSHGNVHYDLKLGYISSHSLAIDSVSAGTNVLDLGCGQGNIAIELVKKGCRVTGLDMYPVKTDCFKRIIIHDLDSPELPLDIGSYDYILSLDCLEHLNSPERLLADLRQKCYSETTKLIITTPNIGFVVTRMGLLFGQFNYGVLGILDLTHKRLFTFSALKRLLKQEGYKILCIKGIPPPIPKALGDNVLSRSMMVIASFLAWLWPAMFSYQIFVEARFFPPLDRLLARTIESSSKVSRANP
ncbi:MAG: bifunctional glycosyltransferase/class I SAM-dependent methyltransferase [Kiritimatiellae bacterium]|nr:bifunctional glycosyltransferase/class I SAM-dependent methyltransferase [Kiritimatiellia bacterium]MDD5522847.1 bifunctional glycosyltransferase/class I SAM-dependent methyltransferase [Kiritimatiellia bacterium]